MQNSSALPGSPLLLPDWRGLRDDLDEAVFVADSCVYLHLYRPPKGPRDELLAALRGVRSRLWVPNQVQVEVLDNSMTMSSAILREVDKEADSFGESIGRAVFGLKRSARHLSMSDPELQWSLRVFADAATVVQRTFRAGGRPGDDLASALREEQSQVAAEIAELMADRTGPQPSEVTRARWKDESRERLVRKLPPTYGDRKKSEDGRHNDCIIWYQILAHAISLGSRRPFVFVTRDHKEGGWVENQNGYLRTHALLVAEFAAATRAPFHVMGTSDLESYTRGLAEVDVWEDERDRITVLEGAEEQGLKPVRSFFL